jgi:hypothetical protein
MVKGKSRDIKALTRKNSSFKKLEAFIICLHKLAVIMGRAGTAARRRARQGLPPVKPGKVGWVHGTKLDFFKRMKSEYLAALEVKHVGGFYSAAAQKYLGTYGYNTPWEGDLEEGKTVADDVDPDEDVDSVPAEVAEERAAYYRQLQGVSSHHGALYGNYELTLLARESAFGSTASTARWRKKRKRLPSGRFSTSLSSTPRNP